MGITRTYLYPRTDTEPITLTEYLRTVGKSRLKQEHRWTKEYREWFNRRDLEDTAEQQ